MSSINTKKLYGFKFCLESSANNYWITPSVTSYYEYRHNDNYVYYYTKDEMDDIYGEGIKYSPYGQDVGSYGSSDQARAKLVYEFMQLLLVHIELQGLHGFKEVEPPKDKELLVLYNKVKKFVESRLKVLGKLKCLQPS